MGCALKREYCTRSCGCSNCEHNTAPARPLSFEGLKSIAERGLCTPFPFDDAETMCKDCEVLKYCVDPEAEGIRKKYNIEPAEDYGLAYEKWENENHKMFSDLFGIDLEWDKEV